MAGTALCGALAGLSFQAQAADDPIIAGHYQVYFTGPDQTLGTDLLGAPLVVFDTGGYDATYSGTIDGPFTKLGGGRLVISGPIEAPILDFFDQQIVVAAGVLAVPADLVGDRSILLAETGQLEILGGQFTGSAVGYEGQGEADKGILIDGHDVAYSGRAVNRFYGPITVRNGGIFRIQNHRVTIGPQAIVLDGTSTLVFDANVVAPIRVDDGATLFSDAALRQSVFGVIGGTWNKTGAGRLAVNAGSFSGVNILEGTLSLGAQNLPLAVTIAGGAKLSVDAEFMGAGSYAGVIGGAGGVDFDYAPGMTFAGASTYAGGTEILAGALRVDGSIANSAASVHDGAELAGTGTVGAVTVLSGGTFAPGDANHAAGAMKVAGDLAFEQGAIYSVGVGSGGQSGRAEVGGGVSIGPDAQLAVMPAAGLLKAGTRYTIIEAGGPVSGAFADITGVSGTAFLGFVDAYDANRVYLDVVRTRAFSDAGVSANQVATGVGLDSLGADNALAGAVAALATDAEAQSAFDQLAGDIHASARGMLIEDSRFVRDAAQARIAAAFSDAGAATLPVTAYGEGGAESVAADTDRFAVWGQAFGSRGSGDADANAAAFKRSTGGFLAGADTMLGGWRVGLMGGYGATRFDADDGSASGNVDSYHLGLYGGTEAGALAVRGGAAYSWNSLSTRRGVAFNGFADSLAAEYDANTAQMFGELAYKAAAAGAYRFEPFANLAYVSVRGDGFDERGGAAALSVGGTSTDATFATLGVRAATEIALGSTSATARGMLGWRHAFGDVAPATTVAFAGGDAFTIAGVPVLRDAALVEAGLDLKLAPRSTLGLSYSGKFGGSASDQGARLNLAVRF